MKQTRILMGMPVTVEIVDEETPKTVFKNVYKYFEYIDETFSPFKKTSEVFKINEGKIKLRQYSKDMKKVLKLAERTKKETDGYFNVWHDDKFDPSGIVKGWAILEAAKLLKKTGVENFYLDVGGDIQVAGKNSAGKNWRVGIRNPFNPAEIVKILSVNDKGIATSGNYIRGDHIYNPKGDRDKNIVSLTIVGPNVCEADRFATAAFAMGEFGISFIGGLSGFEGYMIDKDGQATFTEGFEKYIAE